MSDIVKRIDALSGQVLTGVRAYVERAVGGVTERVDALEMQVGNLPDIVADAFKALPKPEPGPKGDPGERGEPGPAGSDVKLDDVWPLIRVAVLDSVKELAPPERGEKGDPGEPGPRGADGTSVTLDDVRPLVAEAVAALPPAEPGEKGEPGEQGPPGADGMSVTVDDVRGLIADAVREQVELLPPPERGEPGEPGAPGAKGEPGERGEKGDPGTKGEPGESIDADEVRAMIAAAVALEVQLIPRAKDGADGKDCDMSAVAEMIETAITKRWATIVPPKDGNDGRDAYEIDVLPGIKEGRRYERGTWARHAGGLVRAFRDTDPLDDSGLQNCGWDVMLNGIASVTHESDMRCVRVRTILTDGSEAVAAVDMPTVYDAGVYNAAEKYWRGAGVTFGGSWFIAQKDNPEGAPESSKDWRLAVKRGQNGKDADYKPAKPLGVVKLK